LHKDLGGHVPGKEISDSLIELEASLLAEKRKPESGEAGGRRGEEWRITISELTELTEETYWESAGQTENEGVKEVTI